MKSLSRSSIFFIFAVLFVSNSAYAAQWLDMHGTNCVIEYPGTTTNASAPANAAVFYKGWGLDFTQKAFNGNWIHCPIPIFGLQQVRYIYVRYYKSSTAGRIYVIHPYNGDTRVQVATPTAGIVGWNAFSIDLGTFKSFSTGLGVSIGISNGDGNTRFIISDVAAYYQ